MSDRWSEFPPYIPVRVRKRLNRELGRSLEKGGRQMAPVSVDGRGRKLARSFWGGGWCRHLESFSDYANRLPRGRSYLRHGAVLDLRIAEGLVTALVSGSDLYRVEISIERLSRERWRRIRQRCSGRIGSLLELLEGRLSDEVMSVVIDRTQGLLPMPGEIGFDCDCPDWAVMCKHVAAVLFGVGVRLDDEPELLFRLRGVDPDELISGELALPGNAAADATLADADLGEIFGIELDTGTAKTGGEKKTPGIEDAPRTRTCMAEASGVTRDAAPTGATVQSLRTDFGLSVEEFADLMGVSSASVYRWENSAGVLSLRARSRRRLRHLKEIRAELAE